MGKSALFGVRVVGNPETAESIYSIARSSLLIPFSDIYAYILSDARRCASRREERLGLEGPEICFLVLQDAPVTSFRLS